MKRIGYIDARRVRYVADGVSKWAVHSWGVVMGGVAGSMSLYLAADYGAYLNSYAAGRVELCAATEVRIRIGGKGPSVDTLGRIDTAYGMVTGGLIDLARNGTNETGRLRLPGRSDPVTREEEGTFYYNKTTKKVEFCTDSAIETITSS